MTTVSSKTQMKPKPAREKTPKRYRSRRREATETNHMTQSTRPDGCVMVLTNSNTAARVVSKPKISGLMRGLRAGLVLKPTVTMTCARCASDGASTVRKTI